MCNAYHRLDLHMVKEYICLIKDSFSNKTATDSSLFLCVILVGGILILSQHTHHFDSSVTIVFWLK